MIINEARESLGEKAIQTSGNEIFTKYGKLAPINGVRDEQEWGNYNQSLVNDQVDKDN